MKVLASNGRAFYDVTSTGCTCGDYKFRQVKIGGKCKHMIKHFFPHLLEQDKPTTEEQKNEREEMREFFKDGADIDEAYEKFGDIKIDLWIGMGEITKHKKKFVLLE